MDNLMIEQLINTINLTTIVSALGLAMAYTLLWTSNRQRPLSATVSNNQLQFDIIRNEA
jgi:hypothetical protein